MVREAEVEEDVTIGGQDRQEAVEALGDVLGSREAASLVAEIGAMDIVEVFSPKRVNLAAARHGLRQGVSIDLEEMKPDGSERWDLDKDEDYRLALDLI